MSGRQQPVAGPARAWVDAMSRVARGHLSRQQAVPWHVLLTMLPGVHAAFAEAAAMHAVTAPGAPSATAVWLQVCNGGPTLLRLNGDPRGSALATVDACAAADAQDEVAEQKRAHARLLADGASSPAEALLAEALAYYEATAGALKGDALLAAARERIRAAPGSVARLSPRTREVLNGALDLARRERRDRGPFAFSVFRAVSFDDIEQAAAELARLP